MWRGIRLRPSRRLAYHSNHASETRAVLATLLLSILAGHRRYAPITAIRHWVRFSNGLIGR
jgi:hypothetical protein